MKKYISTGITIIALLVSMCGCGAANMDKNGSDIAKTYAGGSDSGTVGMDVTESESNAMEAGALQKEIAYEIVTQGDYNKLALNFGELVRDADLIVRIKVEDVNAFINNNGMIQTEIIPEVQEVYKGSYNNEKLYVNGGEMLYDEYIQNETIKRLVSGHENPDGDEQYKGKYVRQCVDNQYVFNCGEEYVFFAKKRDGSEKYFSLYAYQGTFKISNGDVQNQALDIEEPLYKDICDIFNLQSETENLETETFTSVESTASGCMISKEAFAEKISEMK